jgi:hypothetical protein
MRFSHNFSSMFWVDSDTEDFREIDPVLIRQAMIDFLKSLPDEDIHDRCWTEDIVEHEDGD